jgi:hypothetical protein
MFYERNTAVRLNACGTVLWVGSVASDVQQQPANGGYDYYLVDLKNNVQVVNEMKFDLLKQKPPIRPVKLSSGIYVDHRRDAVGKLHPVLRFPGFREMTPQENGEYSVLIDAIVWA